MWRDELTPFTPLCLGLESTDVKIITDWIGPLYHMVQAALTFNQGRK